MNHTNYAIVVSFSLRKTLNVALQIVVPLTYISTEIQDIKLKKGLALQDILTELHLFVNKSMFHIFPKML